MRGLTGSVWVEGCLILSILSNVLYLIAFIGNGWCIPRDPDLNPEYEGLGLWKWCRKDTPEGDVNCESLIGNIILPDWFISVQALITTSLVGFFISLLIAIIYTCIESCQNNRWLLLVYALITFIFGSIAVSGAILFGIEVEKLEFDGVKLKVSWSYIIACVTIAAQLLCVCLASVQFIIGPRPMTGADTVAVLSNASDMASTQAEPMETAT